MNVQYYGLGCFRLVASNFNILLGPFESKTGLGAPRGQADLILYPETQSSQHGNAERIIDRPGEYDAAGCSIVGLPSKQKNGFRTIYWLELGGVRVMYLGPIGEWNVDSDEISELGRIDVLITPVGGGEFLDSAQAGKIARELEVKLIIPSHFALPGLKLQLDPIDKFLKEMGSKAESQDKLKLTTKDLPQDGVSVAYLLPLGL